MFAGLLFCPDCGAKLHFCAAKSLKPNQEFYRCANYNSGRGTCNIHYIRNVVLEQIVAEAVGSLADFVRCYEPIFLYLLAKNNTAARQSEVQKLKQVITTSERRIQAIDKAIEGLFEANISGKITDERFAKMTANYEKEQKELLKLVADGKKKLLDAEQTKVDLRLLMKALRDYTDIRQLTPEIVNALIRCIAEHGAAPFQRLHRILYNYFVMRLSQLPERLFSLEQADLVLFALALGDKQHHQSDDAQASHSQHHPQGGHVAAVAGGGGIGCGGLLRLLGLAGLHGSGRLLSAAAAALAILVVVARAGITSPCFTTVWQTLQTSSPV